jgi:hypothetical protein
MIDGGVIAKVFFQEKSMKILRTVVLVGLAVSWGQAGAKIQETTKQEAAEEAFVRQQERAHRLGEEADQFYKSKQKKTTVWEKGLKWLHSDTRKELKKPTPLMDACRYQNKQVLKTLLDGTGKSTLNAQDATGMTALMWACKTMYEIPDQMAMTEIVSELINAGANVNIQDNTGWTALMYAVDRNCSGAVQELLNVDGIKKETALEIATKLKSNLESKLAQNAQIISSLKKEQIEDTK